MKTFVLLHLVLMVIALPALAYTVNIINRGSVSNSATVVGSTGGNRANGGAGTSGGAGSLDGADGVDGANGVQGAVVNGTSTVKVFLKQVINGVEQKPIEIVREASSGESIRARAESRVVNGSSSSNVEIRIGAESTSTTEVGGSQRQTQSNAFTRIPASFRQSLQNIINLIKQFFNAL